MHLIAWLPSPVLTHDRRQQIHYLSWSELCITSSMIKKIKANLIATSVAICHLKELCISITWTFSFWVECKFVITSICTDSYNSVFLCSKCTHTMRITRNLKSGKTPLGAEVLWKKVMCWSKTWLFVFLGFFNIKYVHSAMVTGYTKQFWIMVKVDTVNISTSRPTP